LHDVEKNPITGRLNWIDIGLVLHSFGERCGEFRDLLFGVVYLDSDTSELISESANFKRFRLELSPGPRLLRHESNEKVVRVLSKSYEKRRVTVHRYLCIVHCYLSQTK
jgi:hypothetical protein